jgi:hypothetical protein
MWGEVLHGWLSVHGQGLKEVGGVGLMELVRGACLVAVPLQLRAPDDAEDVRWQLGRPCGGGLAAAVAQRDLGGEGGGG